jgi:hypothetical protein
MAEFKDSATALVGDSDCTAAGKSLCSKMGVRGYPTIKHGDPNNMEDYKGGRTLADLQKFASENLGPSCGPANLDLCDDAKKAQIEEYLAMSAGDLKTKVDEENKKNTDIEETFKTEVSKLQKRYEELQKEKDTGLAAVKDSGLGLMSAVQAHKKKAGKSEL